MVRGTVEETLNAMLDAEADEMCKAQRYEHSPDRVDTRADSYSRKLHTKAGEVEVKVPKLRQQTFETAVIERYRRRDISIEEAIVQMYLAGVSVRRVEDITEALWGTRFSRVLFQSSIRRFTSTLSGGVLSPSRAVMPTSISTVSCSNAAGAAKSKTYHCLQLSALTRTVIAAFWAFARAIKRTSPDGWDFLKDLKDRGLQGIRLAISDACLGLVESIAELYPDADWQRCVVHFYRNVFSHVPHTKVREVAAMLKAIHAQENKEAAQQKADQVIAKLKAMKLSAAAKLVGESIHETLTYYNYPSEHWLKLKTNNPMERLLKEARRRTKVVGTFPDGHSALMLVAARLRHVSATNWGTRKYMNMKLLDEMDKQLKYSVA
jgi:transposase-like protein